MGRIVEVTLEDHPVRVPFRAKLVRYLQDESVDGKGWYLANFGISRRALGYTGLAIADIP